MTAGVTDGGSGVQHIAVGADEGDLRLDRWFKRHFPDIGYGMLAKWLRTGQVRVDGRRVKAGVRVLPGQEIRVPPMPALAQEQSSTRHEPLPVRRDDIEMLERAILYKDDYMIALDKPSGLAVQGGSGTKRHLDGMLQAMKFGTDEKPRLVHRLDKDTSGVILLARNAAMAAKLTNEFRARTTVKTYWALVAGVPSPKQGHISMALDKRGPEGGEKVVPTRDGKPATTDYGIIETAGQRMAWLAMRPLTGRTHQLRVHAAEALATPVVGDGKYGGSVAFMTGLANKLHLHAREIVIAHPATGKPLTITAPLTGHMAESWLFLGLDVANATDPFEELE